MDVKRIIKEYYKQLLAYKFDNLDEMDQFLERHSLPKCTQDETDHLNMHISIKETESIINNISIQKTPGPDGFTGEFFFFFLIYLFIYVLGLRFCARAFSSCGKRGPLFIAVHGPLTITASLVAEHRLQTCRLSNCGSRAQLLRGMWDLPRSGLEPMSPALAGRFSTTAPPGKPHW